MSFVSCGTTFTDRLFKATQFLHFQISKQGWREGNSRIGYYTMEICQPEDDCPHLSVRNCSCPSLTFPLIFHPNQTYLLWAISQVTDGQHQGHTALKVQWRGQNRSETGDLSIPPIISLHPESQLVFMETQSCYRSAALCDSIVIRQMAGDSSPYSVSLKQGRKVNQRAGELTNFYWTKLVLFYVGIINL